MLSEEHTEIRRRHGAWFVVSGQIDQRKTGSCRNQKAVLGAEILYREQKLIIFRLGDLGDLSTGKCLIKFFYKAGNYNSV